MKRTMIVVCILCLIALDIFWKLVLVAHSYWFGVLYVNGSSIPGANEVMEIIANFCFFGDLPL